MEPLRLYTWKAHCPEGIKALIDLHFSAIPCTHSNHGIVGSIPNVFRASQQERHCRSAADFAYPALILKLASLDDDKISLSQRSSPLCTYVLFQVELSLSFSWFVTAPGVSCTLKADRFAVGKSSHEQKEQQEDDLPHRAADVIPRQLPFSNSASPL